MKILLFIILSILSFNSIAQKKEEKIPKKITKSIPLLTHYLTDQKSSGKEKVEEIYTWITENIEYDYDLLQSEKYLTGVDPAVILKEKKAICSGYCELMKAMLDEIDIKSESVSGYIHNLHWVPGKIPSKEEHEWIAVRIDETWYLADPTWDAGYIGRIPTHLTPYKPKTYKKTSFKKAKREKKVLAKREKSETARKKKYDDAPVYTDKIGFVKDPKKKYFLIHSDTFLLTHLPIMPIWQFREDYISIEEFSKPEDSLKMILAKPQVEHQDFEMNTNDYITTNYLEQRIICGDKGADFNPNNPTIKAIYYYNYMALINNKNIQKLARGSNFEITPEKYFELNAKTDTIIKYAKIYKELEKVFYKEDKDFDKNYNKASVEKDKVNLKSLTKIEKLNDKIFTTLDKDNDKIKESLSKINELENKIAANYPKAIDYNEPKDLQKQVISNWIDSINLEINALNTMRENLDTLRAHTKFNDILSDVDFIGYLLKANTNYIPFNSYSTTEITDEIDSLINQSANHMIMLFTDSIPLEMLPKDIMNRIKKIETLISSANNTIKNIAGDTKISAPFKYEVFLQAKLLDALKIAGQINMKSAGFNEAVDKGLKKNTKDFGKVLSQMDEQEKLKQAKYKYIQDETETEHLRDVSLIKKMETDTKRWKARFKEGK